MKWTPIGGNIENPGCWDNGNGAMVHVAVRSDGVIRRRTRPYARGRGEPTTTYTAGAIAGDRGGTWATSGVREHRTAAGAAAEQRAQRCPRCDARDAT